nr:copper resistance CopC family protein [uncultured Actinotalea sp.]
MPAADRRPLPVARRRAPLARLLLTALAVLLGGVVGTAPASAHDRLVGSDPADAAVLEQGPASVVLTFNADQLPVGAAVLVRDPAGADRADGDPVVDGATVTQALQPGLPAGAYTVQWRSVSGDGHPIEGTFGFEVTVGVAPPEDEPAPAEASGPAAGADDAGDAGAADQAGAPAVDAADDGGASVGAEPDGAADDAATSSLPVLLGAGLAVAVVAAAAALVLRRRRSAGAAS